MSLVCIRHIVSVKFNFLLNKKQQTIEQRIDLTDGGILRDRKRSSSRMPTMRECTSLFTVTLRNVWTLHKIQKRLLNTHLAPWQRSRIRSETCRPMALTSHLSSSLLRLQQYDPTQRHNYAICSDWHYIGMDESSSSSRTHVSRAAAFLCQRNVGCWR